MSKIEIAYSLEYGECIDAVEAYELCLEGKITNKQAFECCDENCHAQITCSNLDKSIPEMKRSPYFRCYGEHSPKCKHILDYKEKASSKNSKNKGGYIKSYTDNYDNFVLERPKKHAQIDKSTTKKKSKNEDDSLKIKNKKKTANKNHISNYYNIRSIVSKFLKYGSNLSTNYVSIKGYKIPYSDFFIDIHTCDIDSISKYDRVYFSTGKVRKKEDKYVITFDNGFLLNNTQIKTFCILENELINSYLFNNGKIDELERISRKKDVVTIYVYCKPFKWDNKNEPIVFLNIPSLDYIDFR